MSDRTALPKVDLDPKLEGSLLAGHPWVFRDQLHDRAVHTAGWVAVRAGKYEGIGWFDPGSPLAIRLFSWLRVPNEEWFFERLHQAWQLRSPVREASTNAFRWCNGEGDGVPGIVVDYYAGYAVVVCDANSLARLLPMVGNALRKVTPLKGVLLRQRHLERGQRLSVLHGRAPSQGLIVEEHGIRFIADLADGQKTGLFLDHRENRKQFGAWAAGKRVLNLFSYTGGFSLYAAKAGAARVVSVDSAPGAATDALENFRLNGLQPDAHEFVTADVFDYLARTRERGERFDLVVCDPPSFARNARHLDKAKAAYVRVNAAGMRVLEVNGVYAAASCTARIDQAGFMQTVAAASSKARCVFQVLFEGGQAVDHPYRAGHPEARYLKFVLGRVGGRY